MDVDEIIMQPIYAEQTEKGKTIHIAREICSFFDLNDLVRVGFRCSPDLTGISIERKYLAVALDKLNFRDAESIEFESRIRSYLKYLDESDSEVDRLQAQFGGGI